MIDEARRPTLNQLVVTFVPFAWMMAVSIFLAVLQPAVPFARTQYLIRSSLILATPALVEYVLAFRRASLTSYWRLFWTFACVAYLGHLYYGFAVLHRGSLGAVMESEGTVVAVSNLTVTALWTLDVVFSWITRSRPVVVAWLRAATHLLVLVSFVASTVVFKSGLVWWLGMVITVIVICAIVVRVVAIRSPEKLSAAT
jgi:hypothetical protein